MLAAPAFTRPQAAPSRPARLHVEGRHHAAAGIQVPHFKSCGPVLVHVAEQAVRGGAPRQQAPRHCTGRHSQEAAARSRGCCLLAGYAVADRQSGEGKQARHRDRHHCTVAGSTQTLNVPGSAASHSPRPTCSIWQHQAAQQGKVVLAWLVGDVDGAACGREESRRRKAGRGKHGKAQRVRSKAHWQVARRAGCHQRSQTWQPGRGSSHAGRRCPPAAPRFLAAEAGRSPLMARAVACSSAASCRL